MNKDGSAGTRPEAGSDIVASIVLKLCLKQLKDDHVKAASVFI